MFVRARKDEHKETRREAILAAGLALWNDGTRWGDFTMSDVAARAGLVKGTLYLYYATKEQLFLALLGRLLGEYFEGVERRLAEGGRWSKRRVARLLAAELQANEPFVRMLPLMASVLEQNVDYDAALAFKRVTLERFVRASESIALRTSLPLNDALRFLLRASALVTGLAGMAYPSPVVAEVFEKETALRVLRIDLQTEVAASLAALLEGTP
jgi:AcrR family transcriptional regulator